MGGGNGGSDFLSKRKANKSADPGNESGDANDGEWRSPKKIRAKSERITRRSGQTTKPESWETSAERVVAIAKDPNTGQLSALLAWKNGSTPTYHPMEDLYEKCPQLILRYYESLLIFAPFQTEQGLEDKAVAI
ncbi:hypothetical protein GQ44DRAFT_776620 [Phaeosphaeriaceae sp. PMI808]|nr:hypothetical protein GQ44DRAFT_776620 [Phaeosphaeriaceae sp. PMI808]